MVVLLLRIIISVRQTDVSSRESELTLLATAVEELRSMNPGVALPVVEEAVQRVEANITQAKQVWI